MCIRDRSSLLRAVAGLEPLATGSVVFAGEDLAGVPTHQRCLLYTSDAADERSSVDLGGRRILKNKTTDNLTRSPTALR